MRFIRVFVPGVLTLSILFFVALTLHSSSILYAQDIPSSAAQSPQTQHQPQTQEPQPQDQPQDQEAENQQDTTPGYDKAIFQNPIPAGQLTFLKQFEG
jgi:hypothetical protein